MPCRELNRTRQSDILAFSIELGTALSIAISISLWIALGATA